MASMGSRIKHRRLRGLVIHHRLHPSAHPRRLVRRVRSWGERPVAGVCRWCCEHDSCLDACRVASGQKPGMQLTMCLDCAGPADELDHRLATNVARALGPQALRPAFTIENLQWLCQQCHRRKTRLDRCLARCLRVCSLDWRGVLRAWRLNRAWAGTFLPSICSPDAGDDALTLGDVRTAA